MAYHQSHDDFVGLLKEQLTFLRGSAAAFDNGSTAEAKRLAVTIRVLVHDTGASTSLLQHLGVKLTTPFLDTAAPVPPLVPGMQHMTGMVSRLAPATASLGTGASWSYVAPLGNHGHQTSWAPFDDWWNDEIARDHHENAATRRKVVLGVANQDGGAHVADALQEWYQKMAYGDSYGQSGDDPAYLNPAPAIIRQIAYELDETITVKLSTTLGI